MGQPVENRTAIDRDIAEMLERPELASVKRFSEALVQSVESELPPGTVTDRFALLRKCAMVTVLSHNEGMNKIQALADANDRTAKALRRALDRQEERMREIAGLKESLFEEVDYLRGLLEEQAKEFEETLADLSCRELRLPH